MLLSVDHIFHRQHFASLMRDLFTEHKGQTLLVQRVVLTVFVLNQDSPVL